MLLSPLARYETSLFWSAQRPVRPLLTPIRVCEPYPFEVLSKHATVNLFAV